MMNVRTLAANAKAGREAQKQEPSSFFEPAARTVTSFELPQLSAQTKETVEENILLEILARLPDGIPALENAINRSCTSMVEAEALDALRTEKEEIICAIRASLPV
ncbi:hypothetical protein [Acetobacter persici]|uniref:hypothetical protein n=1 Tax=Acetobacter persici TaxID=1076596 RepID=UPI001F46BB94|nr:hypothetical protein [Acetobacter persici]MCG0998170.1 hypothetical protein [Acetobacter persici]